MAGSGGIYGHLCFSPRHDCFRNNTRIFASLVKALVAGKISSCKTRAEVASVFLIRERCAEVYALLHATTLILGKARVLALHFVKALVAGRSPEVSIGLIL